MGGLREKMPVTFWVYLVGALALAGLRPWPVSSPRMRSWRRPSQDNLGVFVVLVIAAFFTAFYIGRQLLLVFFGKARSPAADERQGKPGGRDGSPGHPGHPLGVGRAAQFPRARTCWRPGWNIPSAPCTRASSCCRWRCGSLAVALLGLLIAWAIYGRRRTLAKAGGADPLAHLPLGRFIGAWNTNGGWMNFTRP